MLNLDSAEELMKAMARLGAQIQARAFVDTVNRMIGGKYNPKELDGELAHKLMTDRIEELIMKHWKSKVMDRLSQGDLIGVMQWIEEQAQLAGDAAASDFALRN